jgi:hypothetical protein
VVLHYLIFILLIFFFLLIEKLVYYRFFCKISNIKIILWDFCDSTLQSFTVSLRANFMQIFWNMSLGKILFARWWSVWSWVTKLPFAFETGNVLLLNDGVLRFYILKYVCKPFDQAESKVKISKACKWIVSFYFSKSSFSNLY